MITLLLHYLLDFPFDVTQTSASLDNFLKALLIFCTFIVEAPIYTILFLNFTIKLLCRPSKSDKYYKSLNKKRYEQTDTRL